MSVLDQERQHVSDILVDLLEFKEALDNKGFKSADILVDFDVLVRSLAAYNDALLNRGQAELSHLVSTENQLSEYIIGAKVTLFSDVSSLPAMNENDLLDCMIGRATSGNKAVTNHDDLFIQLDEIIKKQMSYTAKLSSLHLKDSFSDLINSSSSTSGNAVEKIVQAMQPEISELNNKITKAQELLESNQEKVGIAQSGLDHVNDKQGQAVAKIIRTQYVINKVCQDMGISPEFNTSIELVDAKNKPSKPTKGAANDQDYGADLMP